MNIKVKYRLVICLLYGLHYIIFIHGQGIPENVYGRLKSSVTIMCPLRENLQISETRLLWIGPPYEGAKGTTYIINDQVNLNTVLGNRLSVVGDHAAGEYNMKISNIQQNDTGNYSCEYFSDKQYFYLSIIVPLSNVKINPQSITATEGSTSQVTCTTSESVPVAIVKWYVMRLGSSTSVELTAGASSIQREKRTVSTLMYAGNKLDNGGTLYCNASNSQVSSQIQSTNVQISVYYKPSNIEIFPAYEVYVIYVGQTGVNINCSADVGNPPSILYTWSHNSANTSDNPFVITVTKNSSGTYECTASNTIGSISASKNVTVQYGPEIQSFTKQQPDEGSRFVLYCNVSGYPTPTSEQIWWTRQNNNLTWQHGSQLIIDNIQKEHSDTYTCHAQNTLTPSGKTTITKTATRDVQVDVLYKPVLTTFPNYNPLILYEGQGNVQLNCNSTQDNPSNVIYWWTYAGRNYSDHLYNISRITKKSGGNYICYGSNTVGTSSFAVDVVIQYGPSIDFFNPQKFIIGRYATLICNASSYPVANITWTGPNNLQQTGKMLIFNKTSKSHEGKYICTAFNTLTPSGETEIHKQQQMNVNISILYEPQVIEIRIPSIVEGENLTLTCSARANPQSDLYIWTKIGDDTFQQISRNLVITNILRTHSGIYRCTSKNTMSPTNGQTETGEGYNDVAVNVKYAPEIISLAMLGSKEEGSEGQEISLKCEIDSFPKANVTWTAATGLSRPNYMDYNKNISFYNISMNCLDTGSYYCSASNGIGNIKTNSINVSVRCSPRIDIRSAQSNYNRIGIKTGKGLNISARYVAYPTANVTWYFSHQNLTDNRNKTLQHSDNGTSICNKNYSYWQTSELTKSYMTEDDFGMYTVTFQNDISSASSVFHVEAKRAPDAPSSVASECLEDSTVNITWKPEFAGGSDQHFIIQYRKFDERIYRNWTKEIPDAKTNMSETINGLQHGTKYYFRVIAVNENGETPSDDDPCTTAVRPVAESPSEVLQIIGSSLGTLAGVSAIIVALLIYRKRQHIKAKERNDEFSMNGKSRLTQRDSTDDEDGMRDNFLYESAGPDFKPTGAAGGKKDCIHAEVWKPNRNGETVGDVYAEVKKTKKTDAKKEKARTVGTEGTIYENVEDLNKDKLDSESLGRVVPNQTSMRISPPEKSLKPKRNKDGLIYADLELQEGTKDGNRYVIRGIEDRTEYVEVDFSKRADPLPLNDNECEPKPSL